MRRLLIVLIPLLFALPPHVADAQIIRSGRFGLNTPQLWVGGGAGWQQGFTVVDGATGVQWDFSDAAQYGASIERTLNGGTTFGIRATTAKVPLNYLQRSVVGGATQADARVSEGFALLRFSSGQGFHSVIELGVGATLYSDFRKRGTGEQLDPTKPDADFAFVLGYGFGYSISRSFQIDAVQDLVTSLHQKAGLTSGDHSSARITSTRFIARLGLGG